MGNKWRVVSGTFLLPFALSLATGHLSLAAPVAQHCLSLYDPCKYHPGFTHFEYVNPNAPKGGSVKLAEQGTFDNLNPFILKGLKAPGVDYLFDTLMVPSLDEPMSMYGLVAENADLSEDRKTLIFTLRKEARWHDGTPITPEDVVFSFYALKDKGDPSYRILYEGIAACEAIGPRQVRFTFSDTENKKLPLIAGQLPLISKAYYTDKDFEKTTLEAPLSSGPYEVAQIDAGRAVIYRRVKDYWAKNLPVNKGQCNFDTIRYDMYRDENVSLEALKAGEYDFRREYIARNWAKAYESPAISAGKLIKREIPDATPQGMQAFIFNTRKPYLSERKVREAINLALDYEWVNKTIFYGAYTRNRSFFENTDFEAKGLPQGRELELLKPFACAEGKVANTYCLPPELFTQPYQNPVTDGSGRDRTNLLRAQKLLNEAGWHIKDGKRVNSRGEALTIEFLLRQPTMERVLGPMRKNLERLGITASIRLVDDSQYQKRTDESDFDVVSIWINRGLFYPGNEQVALWDSKQADIKGGNNLGGIKNPVVDALTKAVSEAKDKETLVAAGRALDRVLLWEYYVIPNWHSGSFRIAYWNKFGIPEVMPKYGLGFQAWWIK